jgi:hypothetical protein
VLTTDTTVTLSLHRDSNSGPRSYHDRALSTGATEAMLRKQDSDLHHPGPKPGGLPITPFPRAAYPSRTDHLPFTRGLLCQNELKRHSVLGATRTHTAQHLMLMPPAVGLRGRRAATQGRTGSPAVRRRSRKAVRGGEATGAGLEPAGARVRALLGCRHPTRYQYARRDSNPHLSPFLKRVCLPFA